MSIEQQIAHLEDQAVLALDYYRALPPMDWKGHMDAARDHDRFVSEADALRATRAKVAA